jgi:hypothetical protein
MRSRRADGKKARDWADSGSIIRSDWLDDPRISTSTLFPGTTSGVRLCTRDAPPSAAARAHVTLRIDR